MKHFIADYCPDIKGYKHKLCGKSSSNKPIDFTLEDYQKMADALKIMHTDLLKGIAEKINNKKTFPLTDLGKTPFIRQEEQIKDVCSCTRFYGIDKNNCCCKCKKLYD